MSILTKPEQYRVHKIVRNHIWVEVLEGVDQGLRLSVPLHSSKYDKETQRRVKDLEQDEVYTMQLEADSHEMNWRVKEIFK